MSIDLTKLTPLPLHLGFAGSQWLVLDNPISTDSEGRVATFGKQTDAELFLVGRQAFDVMMRRGWTANRAKDAIDGTQRWWVDATFDGSDDEDNWSPDDFQAWMEDRHWPDPFTALVEADKWYAANVDGQETR